MIIVEGPDGAGKSTLIREITSHFDCPVAARAVTSKDGPVVDLLKYVQDDWRHQQQALRSGIPGAFQWLTVYDRYPLISDPIYAPVTRGKMPIGWTPGWFADRLRMLRALAPTVIFCLPPFEAVLANVQKSQHNQMAGVYAHIEKIYWLYQCQVAYWATGDYASQLMVWDYTSPDRDENLIALLTFLEMENERLTQNIGDWTRPERLN